MAEILVASADGLSAAVKVAQSGDTILLQGGVYSGVSIKNVWAQGVTIAPADPIVRATLTDLNISSSSGFAFKNLEFATSATDGFGFYVNSSRDIAFSGVSVHGSLNGNPQDDASGFSILKSSNILIENSEFQQLGRGVGVGSSNGVTISGNNFHDIQIDGIMAAELKNANIVGNSFTNFFPADGDHPDGIQFLTRGTFSSSEDIMISGNVMSRGVGQAFQGIFMRDETGSFAYKNVTISDNLLVGTAYHGITVAHGENLRITDNELLSYAGKTNVNWIMIKEAVGVTATDNSAIKFAFDNVANLFEGGNTVNEATLDDGRAALAAWAGGGEAPTIPLIDLSGIDLLHLGGYAAFNLGYGGWAIF